MTSTILFLDFDGVLHDLNCPTGRLFCNLHLLEALLREFSDVQVVISSAWRQGRTLEDLRSVFSEDIQPRVIGTTPLLPFENVLAHRETECIAWLEANAPEAAWIAIDDDLRLFGTGSDRVYGCDPERGLSHEDLPKLRRRLAALVGQAGGGD